MDETNQDDSEVLETTEEDVVTDTVDDPSGENSEDVEALKEKNRKLFARAKKAEGFELVDGKWVKPEPKEAKSEPSSDNTLTAKDALLLAKADIDVDDLQEVLDYAKFRGKPVADVIGDKTLKTILAERAEERKSAEAAQVKGPRGTSKQTPDQLLEKARTGNLADMDPDKLAEARMAGKLPK